MSARGRFSKTTLSSNNLARNDDDDEDDDENTSTMSQRSSSETALSTMSTHTRSSSWFSEHTSHRTTDSHHSHHSGESSDIFLPQISQLITAATAQIVSKSISSSVITSLSSSSTASSTSGLDRSTVSSPAMPLYAASHSNWEKLTTTTMTTTITMDVGSSEIVTISTTTITMPVPSLTETVVSSSSSHVNLPGTLAPALGLLALLAVASGVIVWRRRKRLRQVQRVPRGIEGGFNKSNARYDVERLSLMEETGHMPPLPGTKIVPNPFDDLPGQYDTRNLDYEEPNSERVMSDSVGLLSEDANSHRQPTPAIVAHEDERNLQTSYADDESISDISSITVPFFEHIKAARRAGIHPSSAGRLLQQQQPSTEEDNLLNSHSTDDA